MEIKFNSKVSNVVFNGKDIEVKSNINTYEKYAIVTSALSSSNTNGRFSRIIFEANLFALIAVYYTNIEIDGMEQMKLTDLYDILDTNGFFEVVIPLIDKEEFDSLMKYAESEYDESISYLKSGLAMIEKFALELTKAILANIENKKGSNDKAVN